MKSIDEISEKPDAASYTVTIGFENSNAAFINKYMKENMDSAYSDKLPVPYNEGGRFLTMQCNEDTYYKLLSQAKKIPGEYEKYEFYFGQIIWEKRYIPTPSLTEIEQKGIITGRNWCLNGKNYIEIEYNQELLCMTNSNEILLVKPIRWIIDTKHHKIFSSRVVAKPSDYNWYNINHAVMQQLPKSKEPYNITNDCFIIDDGALKHFDLSNLNSGYINIPSYITQISCKYVSILPQGLIKIKLPNSISVFSISEPNKHIESIDLYANIEIKSGIIVLKKIIIHYKSYEELKDFLNCNWDRTIAVRNGVKALLYGPKLTESDKMMFERRFCSNKYISIHYKREKAKKDKTQRKKVASAAVTENDTCENLDKQNEIQNILQKIYKYLAYYENSSLKKQTITNKVEEYNQRICELAGELNGSTVTFELENEYRRILKYLKTELANIEKDIEYFKIMDIINECLKALNGEITESKISIASELLELKNTIFPYLKDEYQQQYKQKIIDFMNDCKATIKDYINKRLYNETPSQKIYYTDTKKFEIYFRSCFLPILIRIINSLSADKSIPQKIIDRAIEHMNNKFYESAIAMASGHFEHIKMISVLLDEHMDNLLKSHLGHEKIIGTSLDRCQLNEIIQYRKDKETILSFLDKIEEYTECSNIKEIIINSCPTLRKYVKSVQEQEQELIKLRGEKVPKYTSFDIRTNIMQNTITILSAIIWALGLLECEVTESIKQQKLINSYKLHL